MKRRALTVLFAAIAFAAIPHVAWAQPYPAASSLDATQTLGRDLFVQHCMVCHEHTQITGAPHFAPDISAQSLSGNDKALIAQIGNGSPNMPGFKYVFAPEQIRAVAAYVKTLPTPAPPPARGASREDNSPEGDRHAD